MPITVLSPPWPLAISTQRFRLASNNAFFRSPLTGQMQVSSRPGGRWEFDVTSQVVDASRLGQWLSFLAYTQEEGLTFCWNNYPLARPASYMTDALIATIGTPLVKGASQTGRSLLVDGLTVGVTFKAGDCFSFDNTVYREMHMIKADVTANGSGEATLTFTPAIRQSPADNAAVLFDGHSSSVTTRMGCEVIVASNTEASWEFQGFQMSSQFKLIEVPR